MENMQPINLQKTALVNVHWQYDIAGQDGAFAPFFAECVARYGIVSRMAEFVNEARSRRLHVTWARAAFRPGYPELTLNSALNSTIRELGALQDGTHGAEILAEMQVQDHELVVMHPGTSAMNFTPLDLYLRKNEVDTVLVTGVSTNVTVEGTARDLSNLGYRTIIVSDLCAAASDEAHQASLESFGLMGEVATTQQIVEAFSDSTVAA
jgi:nicotinamidase-related amidase